MKFYEVQTTISYYGTVTIKAENEEEAEQIVQDNISLIGYRINTGHIDNRELLLNFDDETVTYAEEILDIRETLSTQAKEVKK